MPWRMRVAGWALRRQIAAWDAYTADFLTLPPRVSGLGGAPLSAPWALALAAGLVRFGEARDSALLATPSEARWWVGALREQVNEQSGIASEALLKALRDAGYQVDDKY
jgi:hypothetical protein